MRSEFHNLGEIRFGKTPGQQALAIQLGQLQQCLGQTRPQIPSTLCEGHHHSRLLERAIQDILPRIDELHDLSTVDWKRVTQIAEALNPIRFEGTESRILLNTSLNRLKNSLRDAIREKLFFESALQDLERVEKFFSETTPEACFLALSENKDNRFPQDIVKLGSHIDKLSHDSLFLQEFVDRLLALPGTPTKEYILPSTSQALAKIDFCSKKMGFRRQIELSERVSSMGFGNVEQIDRLLESLPKAIRYFKLLSRLFEAKDKLEHSFSRASTQLPDTQTPARILQIQAHTALRQTPPGLSPPPLSARKDFPTQLPEFMTHFFGNSFARESYLEGSFPRVIRETLEWVLSDINIAEGSKQILSVLMTGLSKGAILEQSLRLGEEKTPLIRSQLEALGPGQPLILPFGWTGSPGHATYLEISKNDRGSLILRHFNLGAGSSTCQKKRWDEDTHRFLFEPFSFHDNVEISKFCDPAFLQGYGELQGSKTSAQVGFESMNGLLLFLGLRLTLIFRRISIKFPSIPEFVLGFHSMLGSNTP